MSNDVMHSALTAWATKDLPARLIAAQVAKLLNCTTDDVALLADPDWLDEATKTIGNFWKRKNARRNGMIVEKVADAV